MKNLGFLFLLLCGISAWAQGKYVGTYTGQYEGSPVTMEIQQSDNVLRGSLQDNSGTFILNGTLSNNIAQGNAVVQSSGIEMPFQVVFNADASAVFTLSVWGLAEISFTLYKQNSSSASALSPAQSSTPSNTYNASPTPAGNIDSRLCGAWIKSVNNSSGYGDNYASFSTEILFVLNANGTFEYGASRSMGGGSSWSYDGSSWSAPELSGNWYSSDNKIYVTFANGTAIAKENQLMGTYYIEGNNLLTTSTSGVKDLWQRR
ncbi:MAG: hypothetical protein R2798_08940 [Chitinophagales bacterium]|nr:hypothetical protein [Bacteroidota bacterium]MCB9043921.1 hypothetical protein [Chitinophagales bacterium]